MTLPDLITRLRELEAAATKGPWRVVPGDDVDTVCSDKHDICQPYEVAVRGHYSRAPGDANAALIAEARNALPLLLDEIEKLRAALKPFARLTVEGRDHTDFKNQYPTLAEKIDSARAALGGEG